MDVHQSPLVIYNNFVSKAHIVPKHEIVRNEEGFPFTFKINFDNIHAYGTGYKIKESKANAVIKFLRSISEIDQYKNILEKCIPDTHSLHEYLYDSMQTSESNTPPCKLRKLSELDYNVKDLRIQDLQHSQNVSNPETSDISCSGLQSATTLSNPDDITIGEMNLSEILPHKSDIIINDLSTKTDIQMDKLISLSEPRNQTENLIFQEETDMLRNSKVVTGILKRRGCNVTIKKFDYDVPVHDPYAGFRSECHSEILENIMKSNNYRVDFSIESTKETYDLMIEILKEMNIEASTNQVPSNKDNFIVSINGLCKYNLVGMGCGDTLELARYEAAADLVRALYIIMYKNPKSNEFDKFSFF